MPGAVVDGCFFLMLLFLVTTLFRPVCNAVSAELGPTVLCLGRKLRGETRTVVGQTLLAIFLTHNLSAASVLVAAPAGLRLLG